MLVGYRSKEAGFTLIELVVVIAILALLMTIIVPKVTKALKKAQDETENANLYIIKNALERYYIDNNKYPDILDELIEEDYIETDLELDNFDYETDKDNQSYKIDIRG